MGRFGWLKRLPWSVVALAVAIGAIGCLSLARADDLYGSGGRYLNRQVVWWLLSLVTMLAVAWPSYRPLARHSYGFLAAAVALLAAVYFFPPVNGAHRWIRLGPIGFQPSEFAKLAFVLGLARYLMHRKSYRELPGLLVPLLLVLVPVLLVLKEPDLGTSLVFLPVFYAMLFAAGARPRHLAIVALVGLSFTPLLWSQMSREQKSRITALAEQTLPNETPTRDGYHLHQAKQMFALGGWWGSAIRGDFSEDAGVYRMPEAPTDSIVCVLGERFGVFGLGVTLALFVLLVRQILRIAANTMEPFGRLIVTGIATMIAVQVTINTGMMLGLLPITGLTLPLVSYGGSSLIVNAIGLGLVLNVGSRPGYEVAGEPFAYVDR